MKLTALGCVLVATAALTSCTAAVAPPVQPRSVSESGIAAAAPDPTQDQTRSPGPADGPLQLDDARGRGCASLEVGREYTAWEHVLEPEADVTIGGWSLVGAENVAVGRGFVAEVPRQMPATGFTLGFPLAEDVAGSRNIDWEGRRPAAGATLKAGTRSNFWVRVEVIEGVRRAAYQGLRVHYTSDGQEYTDVSDAPVQFRLRCR